jgi:hypothetical protein
MELIMVGEKKRFVKKGSVKSGRFHLFACAQVAKPAASFFPHVFSPEMKNENQDDATTGRLQRALSRSASQSKNQQAQKEEH